MIRISRISTPRASLLAIVLLAVAMLTFSALAGGERHSNVAAHASGVEDSDSAPRMPCAAVCR